MKTKSLSQLVLLFGLIVFATNCSTRRARPRTPIAVVSEPRPPLPPMPDAELAQWRFDDPAHPVSDALRAANIHVVQSWSGYALSMSGSKLSLLALPAFPTAARTNLS